jgi:hypothetical protein
MHPNLKGFWRLENTLLDASGNGRTGTRNGTGVHVAGKLGRGHQVGPAATDSIEITGSNSSLAFVHNTMVFTIAGWLNVNSLSEQTVRVMYSTNNGSQLNAGIWIALDTRRLAAPNFVTTNDTFRVLSSLGSAAIQSAILTGWHHYALTANGTSGGYVFYRDGVNIGTGTITGTQAGNSFANVLTARGSTGLGTNDVMDELMLFDRALDANDIRRVMMGQMPQRRYA